MTPAELEAKVELIRTDWIPGDDRRATMRGRYAIATLLAAYDAMRAERDACEDALVRITKYQKADAVERDEAEAKWQQERDQARAQRDRLAEALRKIIAESRA